MRLEKNWIAMPIHVKIRRRAIQKV